MNVTFDTNVFVSGFTRPTGRAAQALALMNCLGSLAEKFGRNDEELAIVGAWMTEHGSMTAPTEVLRILADNPDNRILECALAADADVIVTGDQAMLTLGQIGNTRIITWPIT